MNFKTATVAWFVLLTVAAWMAAYYRTFTGFMEWDDEGTMITMVRLFVSGYKPYREIFSGYGPVFFFANGIWRGLTGIPVDHDSTRLATVVISLAVMAICSWTVLRLTRSLAAASVAHLVVFRGLLFFTNEPGHPQELCMLFLAGVAACGLARRQGWGLAAGGALAALLTLSKINIGIFAAAALGLALVFQLPAGRLRRAGSWIACGAALAMPLMLMRVHMNDGPARAYCLVVTLSMAGVLACATRFGSRDRTGMGDFAAAIAGFVTVLVGTLLVLMARGTTLAETYRSLVSNQVKMNVNPGFWYVPIDLHPAWILWAAIALCAALWVRMGGGLPGPAGAVQLGCGGIGLILAAAAPAYLLGFLTPLCWLLLCSRNDTRYIRYDHPRLLLAALTVLQTLTAYPMPGSQVYFIRILLMISAVVVLMDGVRVPLPRAVTAAVLAGVALAYPLLGYRAKKQYDALVSFNQPGAERIRVEPELEQDYQWMVKNLRQHCDTFVAIPGLPSLYSWSGKPMLGKREQPPGPLDMDQWMDLFTPEQQRMFAGELANHPEACAIYHPSGVDFWNTGKHPLSDWPLAAYVMDHFKVIGRSGDYQFMVRKERDLAIQPGLERAVEVQRRR